MAFIYSFSFLMFIIFIFLLKKQKFVAPDFVFASSMLMSSVFYIILEDYWQTDISFDTFLIMLTASLVFIGVSFLMQERYKEKIRSTDSGDKIYKTVNIDDKIVLFIILLSITIIIYSLFMINNIGSTTAYRELRIHGMLDNVFLPNQLNKLLNAFIYVFIYFILFNKCLLNQSFKNSKKIIIAIMFGLVASLILSMGRQVVVEFILYTVVLWLIFKNIKNDKIIVKNIIKIIAALLLLIPLFYYGSGLVGRDFNRISKESPVVYVGKYLSCGINHFDGIVQEDIRTEYFGQSSFAGIYQKLKNMDIFSENFNDMYFHKFSKKFGNTVTIFGRWFEDFGAIGVLIMSAIVSGAFTDFYLRFIKVQKNGISHYFIMLYAATIPALIWAGYDDRIMPLFTVNYFSRIFLLFLVYKFLCLRSGKNEN